MEQDLIINGRFNGPPDTGNGGYVCGLVANFIEGETAEVTLRKPPPLDQKLVVVPGPDASVLLMDGETLIASGKPAQLDLDVPAPPTLEEAETAVDFYAGFESHIFPTCFVCGPKRPQQDGLQIYPGQTRNGPRTQVAAPWTPAPDLAGDSGQVRPEYIWAALDCPGAFAIMAAKPVPAVLGRLKARIERPVMVGQPYIVTGWVVGEEGRKHGAGTAVHSEDGQLCALALATWIAI